MNQQLLQDIVIVSAVRTPVGKFQGAFSDLKATQLGAIAVREAMKRTGLSLEGALKAGRRNVARSRDQLGILADSRVADIAGAGGGIERCICGRFNFVADADVAQVLLVAADADRISFLLDGRIGSDLLCLRGVAVLFYLDTAVDMNLTCRSTRKRDVARGGAN